MVRAEAKTAHVEVLEKHGLTSRERAFWAISRNMHSPPLSLVGEGLLSMASWYTTGETPNLAMVNRRDLVSAWLVSNKTYNLRRGRTRIESFNTDRRYTERLSEKNREWNCFVDDLLMSDPSKAVVSIAEIEDGDGELMGIKYAVTFEFIKGGEISLGKTQRHSWRIGTHFESEEEGKLFLESFGEVMEGPNKRNYVRVLQKEALSDLHKKLHKFKPYEDWEYEIMGKSFNFQFGHESIKAIEKPISFHKMQIDEQGRVYGIDHGTGKRVLIADVFTNENERKDWLLREWEIKNFGYSRRRVVGGSISSVTAGEQEVEEIEDIIQRNPDGSVTQFALKMAKGVPIALREEIYEYLEQNPFLDPKDLSLFIASKIDEMPENAGEELSVFKEGVLRGIESYEAFRGEVNVSRRQREAIRDILPEFRRDDGLFLRREILERRVTMSIDEILRWRRLEGPDEASSSVKEVERRVEKKVDIKREPPSFEREEMEIIREAGVSVTAISYWKYLEESEPVVPEGPGGGRVETTNYGLRSYDSVNVVEELGNTEAVEETESIKDFSQEEEQALDRVTYVRHCVSGERVYKVDKIMLEHDFVNEGESEGIEKIGDTGSGEVVKDELLFNDDTVVDGDLDNTLGVDNNVESAVVLDKIPHVRDFVSGIEADKIDKTMLEHGFVNERESEGEFSDVIPRGSQVVSRLRSGSACYPRGVTYSEVSLLPCGLRCLNIGERKKLDVEILSILVRLDPARKKWEDIVLIKDLPIGEVVELRMYPVDFVNLGMILRGISAAPILATEESELWTIETGKKLLRDLSKNGGVYLSTILLILVPAILYWIGSLQQVVLI